jgi:putative aldouronate transport system substrate-binding protein
MKKRKAIIPALLVLTVLIAGCTSKQAAVNNTTSNGATAKTTANFNNTGFPIVNNQISLNMMGVKGRLHGPWDQMVFFQEMEKMSHIHFQFTNPPTASYLEKKNLAFTSGDYPDVFFGGNLTAADEVNYGKQGILIPLEGLIDQYAPNIKKFFDANPDLKKSMTTPDGHIYSLPLDMQELRGRIPKIWVNGTWLDQMGNKTLPTNTDELYTMLKAFKNSDFNHNGKPDEIPLSANSIASLRSVVLSYFGHTLSPSTNSPIEVNNDKVMFVPIDNSYKEYLAYMHRLYAEKLLDNDIFTQTPQQFVAKGKANQVGMFLHALPMLMLDIKNPADNAKHPVLPPLTSPVNSKKMYPIDSELTRGTFAITNKDKFQEATIRWADYLYTDAGSRLAYMGKEGENWVWLDDQHTKWKFNDAIVPSGMNSEEFRGGKVTPDAGDRLPIIKTRAYDGMRDDVANHYAEQESAKLLPYTKEAFPQVYFTADEQQQLDTVTTDLFTYLDQMEAKFITGNESLDNWNTYVQTVKKMNVDKMVQIYQAAYDRWKTGK